MQLPISNLKSKMTSPVYRAFLVKKLGKLGFVYFLLE
jgi:hypothetical protein